MSSPASGAAKGSAGVEAAVENLSSLLSGFITAQTKANSDIRNDIKTSVDDIKKDVNKSLDEMDKKFTKVISDNQEDMASKMEDLQKQLSELKAACKETDEKVQAMQADAAKPSSDTEDADAAMVGGEYEGDSQTSQGKRKVFKSAFGPSYSRAAGASSSASGGQSFGPSGHFIGTPRGASSGPAPAGPASSGGGGKQAPATGQYCPEKIWVKGFTRRISNTQARDIWAKLFAVKLPQNLRAAATVPDEGIGYHFQVVFATSAQAAEALAILRPLCDQKIIVHWDNHQKQDHPLRVAADRTLRGRVAGRVVHSLWKSLEAWLKDQSKPAEWVVNQDKKRAVYIEYQGDIFVIFDLRVSKDGEIEKLTICEDGCQFIGLSESSAQDMIDTAAQQAAQPQ